MTRRSVQESPSPLFSPDNKNAFMEYFHLTGHMGGSQRNKLIFLIFNMLWLIDMEIVRIFHTQGC